MYKHEIKPSNDDILGSVSTTKIEESVSFEDILGSVSTTKIEESVSFEAWCAELLLVFDEYGWARPDAPELLDWAEDFRNDFDDGLAPRDAFIEYAKQFL